MGSLDFPHANFNFKLELKLVIFGHHMVTIKTGPDVKT
jgi:hypothetical protein